MNRLKPIANRVLVQLEPPPDKQGSILLPGNIRHLLHPTEIGCVLELGKDCDDLKPGDRVHLKTNQGTGMTLNGHKCVMIDYRDVLAIIQ